MEDDNRAIGRPRSEYPLTKEPVTPPSRRPRPPGSDPDPATFSFAQLPVLSTSSAGTNNLDRDPVIEDRRRREQEQAAKARAAWAKFRPVVDLALTEFLQTAHWPERERLRRKLTQRGFGDLSPEEMLDRMPKPLWEQNAALPDQVILSLQALQELPEAKALVDACIAMVQRAYELYSSDTDDDLKLQSDDPVLLSAAGGDAGLLRRALQVLDQHPPNPLGGWASPSPDSTPWSRWLYQTVMPFFGGVTTIQGYIAAQAKIINEEKLRSGHSPGQLRSSQQDQRTLAIPESPSRIAIDMTNTKGIFFSHAHADRGLADLLRSTLLLAGVPEQRLFYSSSRATGIPSGEDVRPYLRRTLREAELVIELISETFLTRPYCLMELGGAWTLGTPTYPIVVLPLTRDAAAQQIGNVQMGVLGTESEIDELFDELHDRLAKDVGISAETGRWNRAIREFKQMLPARLEVARTSSAAPSSRAPTLRASRRRLQLTPW